MTRLIPILAFALLAVVVAPATAGPDPVPVEAERPNVLIVVTDDQRAEDFMPVMPNVRRLFQDGGTRFPRAFVTTPLCCPSRGSIFSGRYAHNHGVLENNDQRDLRAFDHERTIQCALQAAGFRTGIAGKFFNAWRLLTPPPCFDRWATFNGGYRDPTFNVDGVVRTEPGYSTDSIGGFAEGFLDGFEADDASPWFLYVAPNAPHGPFEPEPEHALDAVPPWQPDPAVTEQDRSDKPPVVRSQRQDPSRAQQIRQAQLRTLISVDEMVGRLFDHLDALGEAEHTLAFFVSDNGFLWGDHGIVGTKRFPYLGSVQVPFLVRWPGHLPAGVVDDRLVANIDIAPTVLDATGLSPPEEPGVDGLSLLAPGRRDRLLLEYFQARDAPNVPAWAASVTDTYQYVEWYDDDGAMVTFREYYDLVGDPWQLDNLLGDADPANDPDVDPIAERLVADRTCAGDGCPRPSLLFADDVAGGLAAWPVRSGLSVSADVGHAAPPSIRAVAVSTSSFGVHPLEEPQPSVCLRASIDLSAIETATVLLRLRSELGEGIVQVLATPARALRIRSETGRRTFDPGVSLTAGWHTVDLCATVGELGSVRTVIDGVDHGAWRSDLGDEPIGQVQIFDERPRTFAATIDDLVVVTDPGGAATVP